MSAPDQSPAKSIELSQERLDGMRTYADRADEACDSWRGSVVLATTELRSLIELAEIGLRSVELREGIVELRSAWNDETTDIVPLPNAWSIRVQTAIENLERMV
jgi:hypothetical protein